MVRYRKGLCEYCNNRIQRRLLCRRPNGTTSVINRKDKSVACRRFDRMLSKAQRRREIKAYHDRQGIRKYSLIFGTSPVKLTGGSFI